jgi:hypothetical protein
MKTPISKDQRKALILSLASGSFDITIFPELAKRMPNTVTWFEFWQGVTGDNCPPTIPLSRQVKITLLKALKDGSIDMSSFTPIVEVEEKRNRFEELMIAANADNTREL